LEYRFYTRRFKRHDPKGLVLKHHEQVSYNWPYGHQIWEEETLIEYSHNWDEIFERRRNPRIIVFRSLFIDEQILEINHGLAAKREVEEARRQEEIILKDEVEHKSIQKEQVILHKGQEI